MLQSLRSVDAVIPFDPYQNDGETMFGLQLLIDKVKPTHYIRGEAHPDAHIQAHLELRGVKLELIPIPHLYSATAIIKGIEP